MVGQAFIFLVAGFEATATTLMYLAYELSRDQISQKKVHDEVVKVYTSKGGVLDYDTVREMTFLDQCVKETMRLHPFIGTLFRTCTKDYTFPNSSISLKTGDSVFIPVAGILLDPTYYPDPEKFQPERFDPEMTRPNCTFIPFGDGPRMCIAMRFALTEIKLCMARILLDYRLDLSSHTKLPIRIDPTSFAALPTDPLYFDLTKINGKV